jgi:uncharacterized protein YjdB
VFSFIICSYPIKAASDIKIIQDSTDLSLPLKDFIYVGERMDWDVLEDGLGIGGLNSEGYTWSSSDESVVSIETSEDGIIYGILVAHKKGSAIISVKDSNGNTASAKIRIKQPCTSISINGNTNLVLNKTSQLKASINPSTTDDINNGVVWSSSNNSIVSIDSKGNIKGLKLGSATISATFYNENRFNNNVVVEKIVKSIKINVIRPPVESIKLNYSKLILYPNNTITLKASIKPSNASNNITYQSSNSKIVKVDSKGKLTALSNGSATIIARINNKSAQIKVLVYTPVTKLSMPITKVLPLKQKINLKASITPSKASGYTLKYTSSNKKYGSVNNKGLVKTYNKQGSFFLNASASNIKPSITKQAKSVSNKTLIKYLSKSNTI